MHINLIEPDYNAFSEEELTEELLTYAVQDVVLLEQLHKLEQCINSSTQDCTIKIGYNTKMVVPIN